MRQTACATVLVVCALAVGARADDVVTKSGKTYSGTIVAEDEHSVTVDTAALGRMKVARADIERIDRSGSASKDAPGGAGKPADAKKDAPAAEAVPAAGAAEKAAADDAAKAKAKAEAEAAAKAKADAEAVLSAQERDRRRRATRIVRRTDPAATKPAAKASAPAEEAKATLSGAQLAGVARGSWVVVVQPPTQVEGASGAIAIGRRTYARLESVGTASAWISVPMAAGDERVAIRLADVQRHAIVKGDEPRTTRMMDGIDPGAWVRAQLSDGTSVEGVLQSVKDPVVTLARVADDGSLEPFDFAANRLVAVDGLMRSTATRMTLGDLTVGEPLAVTLWPDGRLVAGTVADRNDACVTVRTASGATERICIQGPVADARRVPLKWRAAVTSLRPRTTARMSWGDDFPDAHVERDILGVVLAASAYAVTLDTPDGVLVVPYEAVSTFEVIDGDGRGGDGSPMKKSDRSCALPVLPGDPAAKAQGLDPASGVCAVTDGDVVRNVLVSRPFEGAVFGVRLGDRAVDAQDATDIRFDTVVVPRHKQGAEDRPAEMTSNSLETMRVTLLLDAAGSVSAMELTAR